MNPALLLLLLLVAGGFWACRRRDRSLAWAWLWLGLAGSLLLGPALWLADGIPSPAASLGADVPWQGVSDPADGNPVLRDVTFQIQPWLIFLRRELRSGRLPEWNPHQFAGAPFWANGQSAPLFPLHLVFVALPLQIGFVLLPWLRFVAAGLGVWMLGRQLGLRPTGALLAALAFPLSGMLVSFLLFPMGNALALVPWVLWAVERLATGVSGPLPLALTAGLQLLAGHPETVIHTGLLSVVYLAVRGSGAPATGESRRPAWRCLPGFLAGWLLAVGLGAVQLVPLVLNVVRSSRWEQATSGAAISLPEAGLLLLRLVLPQLFGHPAQGTWWGPFNYSATAVYLGALALPLASAGLTGLNRRWGAVAAVTGVSLLVAYHLPGIYDLVRSVPILGRVAHHRLIFGVELGLALLAGRGLDRWRKGDGTRGLQIGVALALGMLLTAWLAFSGDWQRHGLTVSQLRWTLWGAAIPGLLLASLALPPARRTRIAWLLPALLTGDLLGAHGAINPALPIDDLYPVTGAVARLQELSRGRPSGQVQGTEATGERSGRVVGIGQALRPNAALVYGLFDLRGDDPVKAARFERLYRSLAGKGSAVFFEPVVRWDVPLLDRLSVRWVMGGPGSAPPRADWIRIYDGRDARLWERPEALPVVRWRGTGAPMRVTERRPGVWVLDLGGARAARGSTEGPGREVVVAELWDPGWRAWVGESGGEAKVRTAVGATKDGLLCVAVPENVRRVELRYRAPGLVAGALGTLGALGILLACGVVAEARRRNAIIRPG